MGEKSNLIQTIQRLWNQTSVPARISVSAFTILSVVALVGIAYWLMQPHYVPLANNLAPQKAAEVVSLLDADGIANKLNFSGTGILVDQTKWNKGNSLISSVVEPNQVESNPMGSSLLGDPTTRDHRIIRDLEIRLEKSISQMKLIESAVVHLGIPEASPFVREQGKKTASIIVGLRLGTSLNRKLSKAIVGTVSSSVDGLLPENINLSDREGNSFVFDDSLAGAASGQLEYQRQYEQMLARKAETMLEEMLGHGRAVVRVTADFDFTKVEMTQKRFDPKSKVVTSEEIENQKDSRERNNALGAAGTATNLGTGGRSRNQTDVLSSTEKIKSEYKVDETIETTTRHPGKLIRLTIAAMVQLQDEAATEPDDPKSTTDPPAPLVSQKRIESLIRQAVGFDERRNDQIEVLVVDQLAGTESLADFFVPPSAIESWTPLVKSASLGLAALVALILGLLTINKIKSVVQLEPVHQSPVTPERARQLSELSLLARKNPEVLGSILSAWAGDEETTATTQKKAA